MSDRDPRIEETFHACRALPAGAERRAYLDRAAGGDAVLRARVEELLAAEAAAPASFLEPEPIPAAGPGEQPGQMIDRYKLLQEIGQGGMGTVWMAEQREPVVRKVALKIIKLGMDTRDVVVRFEAERQALALMDHPHIARVIDGGATAAGRPFFVMELVRGVPITEYADSAKLGMRERLELFTKVCEAIQHAHHKGIIHRDIKPSNVLVTLHDGVAMPKVIDFGIAKATSAELTKKTLFTQYAQILGTPEYMAPEQAEMSGLDIDTRADVYSLGVLLYELLTGVKPFDVRIALEAGFSELLRTIREVDPVRPSTRVSTLGESASPVAAHREVNVESWSNRLRGDLDWIVMKALEKDRTRRYATPSAFAEDIGRCLRNEAVTAAPPSASYRLRKLVRRNRATVTAAGFVAAALVLGIVGTAWQAARAREQRDLALAAREGEARERKTAEAARDKAAVIAEFMGETLGGAGPSVARGRDITMLKEMMDRAAARIEAGALKSAPEAELRLRQTIGGTYIQLALYPEAARMLEPAVAMARQLYPGDHAETGNALNNMGGLLHARGDLAGAERFFRESLEMGRRLVPGDHADTAVALLNLGGLLHDRGDLAGAEHLSRQSLDMCRRLFPGDHATTATVLGSLAHLLQVRSDLAGAEPLLRESLEMRRRLAAGDDPDLGGSLSQLGLLLRARGDGAAAEPLLREALAMRKRLFPGDHPHVAGSLGNLAVVLQFRGDIAGAERLFRESLAMTRRVFPGDHPNVAMSLDNLAKVWQGRVEEAEALLVEALDMRRRLYGGDHPDLATGLNNLAQVLHKRGDLARAEPLYRESLAMFRRLFPGDHPDVAGRLMGLALLFHDRGDMAAAVPLARESVEMSRRLFPGDHPDLAHDLFNLATVLGARGDLESAEPPLGEALAMRKRLYGPDHPDVLTCENKLAVLCWQAGRLDRSVPLLERVLEARTAVLGRQHADTLTALGNLGVNYRDAGRLAEAIPLLEEAYQASKTSPHMARIGTELLLAYERGAEAGRPGDSARAVSLLQELLADARKTLPGGSPQLAGTLALSGLHLLGLKAWPEAESVLRESLAIRENALPDDWLTFNTRSLLGGALLGQGRYAEAEPLLLDGYRGMKEREATIPPQGATRIPESLERLVRLYEAIGDKTRAAEWKAKLDAMAPRGTPAAETK